MMRALCLAVILTGCISLQRDPPQTTRYVLDVARPGEPAGDRTGPCLQVRTFHASSAAASSKLTYRTGPSSVETDFYNEFLVPPAHISTELTRAWLDASGRFQTVLGAGGPVAPDWILDGDLLSIFGDDRDGEHAAVLEIHVIVVRSGTAEIVHEATYRYREVVENGQPATLVEGWQRGLARILGDLESDLGNAG